jgi:hypothetical protein
MRRNALLATLGLLFIAACGGSPAAHTPATSPSPTALSTIELKYAVIAQLGPLEYCDPDLYPLGREVTPAYITARLSDIAARDPQTYQAILAHDHLTPPLTQQQEQQVYGDDKVLAAFQLTPNGAKYDFSYPVRTGPATPSTLTKGTIDQTGSIVVQSRSPYRRSCPICLAASTTIDTPNGPVAVTSLRPGMPVWTADLSGHRQPALVLEVGSMLAPAGHQVVHLALADGREVWVSPGHPTTDGRHVGDLIPGDVLDGSRIVMAERTPYVGSTYDILPSGPTGAYWANGVPLGSTLKEIRPE